MIEILQLLVISLFFASCVLVLIVTCLVIYNLSGYHDYIKTKFFYAGYIIKQLEQGRFELCCLRDTPEDYPLNKRIPDKCWKIYMIPDYYAVFWVHQFDQDDGVHLEIFRVVKLYYDYDVRLTSKQKKRLLKILHNEIIMSELRDR